MEALKVVEAFRTAQGQGDFGQARGWLADEIDFVGPIDRFSAADDYIEAIRKLSQIATGARTLRTWADGDDVCLFYELQTSTPAGDALVAEWYRVETDKIVQIRALFDPRPFAPPQ